MLLDQIFLIVHGVIAVALVGTILMQRSEGGALGIGGGPGGMMSARGAGNFLTRATTILAVAFLGMSIMLAIRSGMSDGSSLMDGFSGVEAPASTTSILDTAPTGPLIPEGDVVPGAADAGSANFRLEDALEAIDPDAVAPTLPSDIPAPIPPDATTGQPPRG